MLYEIIIKEIGQGRIEEKWGVKMMILYETRRGKGGIINSDRLIMDEFSLRHPLLYLPSTSKSFQSGNEAELASTGCGSFKLASPRPRT